MNAAEMEARIMAFTAELKVTYALEHGLVEQCPSCQVIHAGLRFLHPDGKKYCSTECFQNRPVSVEITTPTMTANDLLDACSAAQNAVMPSNWDWFQYVAEFLNKRIAEGRGK